MGLWGPLSGYVFVFVAAVVFVVSASTHRTQQHMMQKRQIFREQVLPHAGGKIPEEAFRTDRLALNRLNAMGIAIPDGVLLEARSKDSHYQTQRDDPDISKSIIRLVQKPDGRYAPPEGHYPFDNLIESTYIIRPHVGVQHFPVPPRIPVETTWRLPGKPFFVQDDISSELFDVDNVDAQLNLLNSLNGGYQGARLWTGFGTFYHDNVNRILRQATHEPVTPPTLLPPTLSTIPRTTFACPPISKGYVMVPDLATTCQVFHLCHSDGSKESFLCPSGMRFDPTRRLCHTWTEVPCSSSS